MAIAPKLLKRKRVPILSGDGEFSNQDYVDVPVIAEMSLLGTNGQEFRYRFGNTSSTQLRTVRVKQVGNAAGALGSATVSLDQYANVERIQTIAFTNALESTLAWRTDKKLKNQDPAPKQPDGLDDPRHLKVHYVRFYKDNDVDGNFWVDVELVDHLALLSLNAQEYVYRLRHPTPEEYAELAGDDAFGQAAGDDDDPYDPIVGFCPPDLALLGVEFDDFGDPLPTRTDPFQNICNVGGGNAVVFFPNFD